MKPCWNKQNILDSLFYSFASITVRASPPLHHTFISDTHCRTPWISNQVVARPLCETTQHRDKEQTSMPEIWFEPTISTTRWPRPSPHTTQPLGLANTCLTLLTKMTYCLCSYWMWFLYTVSIKHISDHCMVFCPCVTSKQVTYST